MLPLAVNAEAQLMAFDQGGDELGKFSTIAGNVFTLSNAIAGA